VVPPGLRVSIHESVEGRPLNATLPVASVHVGCVRAPITGAVGVAGCWFIRTLPDADDVQPNEFVTVNVEVPVASPVTV
jgi:hypothetical protein